MSEKKKMTLIERIVALLDLNDAGKLKKFFERELREFTRAIEKLEMNKKAKVASFKSQRTDIADKLEDANASYEDAKTQITPEDVQNNEGMKMFSREYWGRIDRASNTVKGLTQQLEDLKDVEKAELAEIDEQIAKYKARIAIIKETK